MKLEVNFYQKQNANKISLLEKIEKAKPFKTKSKRKKREIITVFLNGIFLQSGGKNPNFHLHSKEWEHDKIIHCEKTIVT